MTKLSALLHTHNDALRIGRAVESLRSCDEILVVDHASTDDTVRRAREHGAKIKEGVPGVNHGVYAMDAAHDWILCVLPTEAMTETLEAAIFEWKHRSLEDSVSAFSVAVREEIESGWRELGPQVRLVNRKRINWPDDLPGAADAGETLDGHLQRFLHP